MADIGILGQLQYGDLTLLPGFSLESSGAGNLNVAGSTLLGGPSVTISGTISVGSSAVLDSTLQVNGVGTFDDATFFNGLATFNQGISLLSTIDSTSTSSGALIIAGGVGITKNIHVGGVLDITGPATFHDTLHGVGNATLDGLVRLTNTAAATSTTTGAISIAGGASIANQLYVGGGELFMGTTLTLSVDVSGSATDGTTKLSSPNNDLYLNDSGTTTVYINNNSASDLIIGNTVTVNTTGILNSSTIDSTNVTSGSIITAGGIGIGKSVFLGGNLGVKSTTWTSTGNNIYLNANSNSLFLRNAAGSVSGEFESSMTDFNWRTTTGTPFIALNLHKPDGIVSINTTIDSTGTNSGALQVAGGAGFGKDVYVGGNQVITGDLSVSGSITTSGVEGVIFSNTTGSTSTTTGSVVISGGLGVAQNIYAGGYVAIVNTTGSTSTSTGALIVSGGVGIAENLNVGGNSIFNGDITLNGSFNSVGATTFTNTTDSTAPTNGSLILAGGLGVGKHATYGYGISVNHTALSYTPTLGQFFDIKSSVFTDNASGEAGSLAAWSASRIQSITVAATSANVTYSAASSFYVAGAPTNGTNVTFTNAYAVHVASGRTFLADATSSTSSASGALIVAGGVGIGENLNVQNTLFVKNSSWTSAGNDAYFNANTATISLRNATGLVSGEFESTLTDFNFRTTTATPYIAFNIHKPDGIIYINTTTSSTSATSGALVVAGGVGVAENLNVGGDLVVTGSISSGGTEPVNFASTDDSTSPITGAIVITGGMGIGKHVNIGYGLQVNQTAYSFAPRLGQFFNVGNAIFTDNSTAASGTVSLWSAQQITGAVVAASNTAITYTNAASLYIAGPPTAGTNVTITNAYAAHFASGKVLISDTSASTSPSSGAFVISGGVGIVSDLNVGGNLSVTGSIASVNSVNFSNTTDSTSSSTGSVTIAGGLGIAKNTFIGGNLSLDGTNPLFTFGNSGQGLPSFTTRSVGTKVLLWDSLSGSSVDWAFGVSTDTLWSSLPTSVGSNYFRWYAGTTNIATMNGLGVYTLHGTTDSTNSTSGTLVVSGGVGISKTLHVDGVANLNNVVNINNAGGSMSITAGYKYAAADAGWVTFNPAGTGSAFYKNVDIAGNIHSPGFVVFDNTADSTSATTGAITIAGSAGLGGNIFVGGVVRVSNNNFVEFGYGVGGKQTNAGRIGYAMTTPGALDIYGAGTTAGSRSIVLWDNVAINNNFSVLGTDDSVSTATGALVIGGGLGLAKSLFMGGNLNVTGTGYFAAALTGGASATFAGIISTTNTTDASSVTTGSIVAAGGLGISLTAYIGNNLNVGGNSALTGTLTVGGITHITNLTDSTTVTNGALIVDGGVGIGRNLTVNNNLTVGGNTVIAGNLIVNGTRTEVNVSTLTVNDNIILVNAAPGGSSDSGYGMKRWQLANDSNLGDVVNNDSPEHSGTARVGGTSTSIVLATSANSTNNYFADSWIRITGGTGVGQVRRIATYNGATRTATIYSTADQAAATPPPSPVEGMDWTTVPDATSTYEVFSSQYILTYYDEQYKMYVLGSTQINPVNQPNVDIRRRLDIHGGSMTLDRYMKVDTINEKTANAGVTVEGVLIKDNNLTGVGKLNGNTLDVTTTVQLVDNDNHATVVIPNTLQYGTYILMVSDILDTGATAIFMCSGSVNRGGSVSRVVSTPGAGMEHLTIVWNSGDYPRLKYLNKVQGSSGSLRTYRVKIITSGFGALV